MIKERCINVNCNNVTTTSESSVGCDKKKRKVEFREGERPPKKVKVDVEELTTKEVNKEIFEYYCKVDGSNKKYMFDILGARSVLDERPEFWEMDPIFFDKICAVQCFEMISVLYLLLRKDCKAVNLELFVGVMEKVYDDGAMAYLCQNPLKLRLYTSILANTLIFGDEDQVEGFMKLKKEYESDLALLNGSEEDED